ncbi:Fe(2+) transporter permease subunit FeoB [Rhodospirillum sp. A1_3_36]|uniref:Fe(2+) transporter permease subunit FeoB n=1 Tax=Rhodospirillum sp. A1_3_36 TaxID=3391666 RepID=UPI0039A50620
MEPTTIEQPLPRFVALIGPPNAGKSTVFNRLTGANQRVGNFPGVTVERKEGRCRLPDGQRIGIIDLPGLYSLAPRENDGGLDHAVARDYLATGEADLVLNVVDATRLEQSLYLTVQLLEQGLPCVVALNMMDAAEAEGLILDVEALSDRLGCPVVPLSAAKGRGIDALKAFLANPVGPTDRAPVAHLHAIEEAIAQLEEQLALHPLEDRPLRWTALALLEGDPGLLDHLQEPLATALASQIKAVRAEEEGEDPDSLIADARFEAAHGLATSVSTRNESVKTVGSTDRIDSLALHPLLGVPLFLLVMYGLFTFTINLGGAFIDFFDIAAGALFVDGLGHLMGLLGAPDWARVILADGLGGGIQVVATFIPIVGALFLALTVMEDSGYMARAAFVMDRAMNRIGLPGKAVVPLIVGFGCNVPAVMATRVLERPRDRILTIAMAPFMSCGARLAVYALFVAAFFPTGGQNVVMMLYLVGIGAAILTALVLRRTLLTGEGAPFMMELPTYRMPRLRDVLIHAWTRLRVFLLEAGQVIALVVMALNILGALGTDGRFDHAGDDSSLLAQVSQVATPLFHPMGLSDDNWPAVVGIVTGLFAKEAVVGTLDALYSPAGQGEGDAFDLGAALSQAAATVPENLAGLAALLTDPLNLGSLDDPGVKGGDTEGGGPTMTALARGFDGALGAMAYMLFILLYVPCVAVLGAIRREAGWGWTSFVAGWTLGLAYAVATVVYQAGTLSRHPQSSSLWIGLMGLLVVGAIGLMAYFGRRLRPEMATVGAAWRANR